VTIERTVNTITLEGRMPLDNTYELVTNFLGLLLHRPGGRTSRGGRDGFRSKC
jgi:hypothetical protein